MEHRAGVGTLQHPPPRQQNDPTYLEEGHDYVHSSDSDKTAQTLYDSLGFTVWSR